MKDRVRANTSEKINYQVDEKTKQNLERYYSLDEHAITTRINELDREWDIERALEVNMSVVALSGIALTVFHNRRWLALPAIVLSFFMQHAIQGWCPPLPILRKLGFRTRKEIDREKYALKMLRGDFNEPAMSADARPKPSTLYNAVVK